MAGPTEIGEGPMSSLWRSAAAPRVALPHSWSEFNSSSPRLALPRSKSSPLWKRPCPLSRKMSLLSGRAVIIGLGSTSSSIEAEMDFDIQPDEEVCDVEDDLHADRPATISDLPDRCIMSIMANIKNIEDWVNYKLVCKEWRRLANESLQALHLRDSGPLVHPGFVEALKTFDNLRSLQVYAPIPGIMTDDRLISIAEARPDLRSLHISYREDESSGAEPLTNGSMPAGSLSDEPAKTVTAEGLDFLFSECHSLQELTIAGVSPVGLGHLNRTFQLPDSIHGLQELRCLAIQSTYCSSLAESFGCLKKLSELTLSCGALTDLPETLGQLTQLTSLDLSSCHKLVALPESLGQFRRLTNLNVRGCSSLATLPESLGKLSSLTRLNCQDCHSLEEMPLSIGELISLTDLHLHGCEALASLPSSIGKLTNLVCLGLRDCPSLAWVPESVESLVNLNEQDHKRMMELRLPRYASPSPFDNGLLSPHVEAR